mmetsp:Transcript_6654/g.16949  ORF Transcript_6654/g.16949 Transcript_6654/m.16949 type:complete len:228 (-) Transcript_6654:1251-1934(-)
MGLRSQPGVQLLPVLYLREPVRGEFLQEAPRPFAVHVPAPRGRGWRPGPPRGCFPLGEQHQPRDQPEEVPVAAVPLLPRPDRLGHVPPFQQLPVLRVLKEPLPRLLRAGLERGPVDGRPSADPHDEGAARRGVQHRHAGLQAQHRRLERNSEAQRPSERFPPPPEDALGRWVGDVRERPLPVQRAQHKDTVQEGNPRRGACDDSQARENPNKRVTVTIVRRKENSVE